MRFLRRPEGREGYFLEISVGGHPRRALESAAGGMEEVLTGVGHVLVYISCHIALINSPGSLEFRVARFECGAEIQCLLKTRSLKSRTPKNSATEPIACCLVTC